MSPHTLTERLGLPIQDAEEETFLVFSQSVPEARNLGFVDARATSVTLPLGDNREITVSQSPSLLQSSLSTGTTGAVVWRVSPLVASWMTEQDNVLFASDTLRAESTVIELGCGVSGVLALALSSRIGTYVCTDQPYVLKMLRQNILDNLAAPTQPLGPRRKGKKDRKVPTRASDRTSGYDLSGPIKVLELDWETSSLETLASQLGPAAEHLDAVIACDCIYNSHLVQPLVQTCAGICRSRTDHPMICLVAQQVRSEEVFQEWLQAFMDEFTVWRVPDTLLSEALQTGEGYLVHVGLLKQSNSNVK